MQFIVLLYFCYSFVCTVQYSRVQCISFILSYFAYFCLIPYSTYFLASQVDFDRTKHLSEYSIKKRNAEREKLEAADREKDEKLRRKREMEEMKLEAER